jgi:hypothetical protein
MRNALTLICLAGLLLFAGCFDSEETLVINADLSGTAQMKFAVEKSYLDQMKTMYEEMAKMMPDAEIPSDPKDMMFNKVELEQALAGDDAGVELVSYETSESEDSHIWDMRFSFEDVNRLDAVYSALSPDDDDDEFQTDREGDNENENHQPLMTKQADGTWLFYRPFEDASIEEEYSGEGEEYYPEDEEEYSDDDYDDGDEPSDPLASEMMEGLDQLTGDIKSMAEGMKRHKMVFVVTFPGEIVESNATSVDGRTATWEYTLDQLDKDSPVQRAVIR